MFILHEVRKCKSWSMILNGNTITFYKPVEYNCALGLRRHFLSISRVSFRVWLFSSILFLSSCAAAPPNFQPQINSLVLADKSEQALKILDSQEQAYGKKNALLFLLDKALVLHLAKRYPESIEFFEKAKLKFDELYTQSISQGLATWVVNDYAAAYHGEDFEHVQINIFQALNYAALNNFSEALVEARDVDNKLQVINTQYPPQQKNVYKEDACARFLMGIFYEAAKTPQDYNDAFISYRKALEIYNGNYSTDYHVAAPGILKKNLLTAAQFMGPQELDTYRREFPDVNFLSLKEKEKYGQLYLIQYNGSAPIKVEGAIPVPLPGGILNKIAFPVYKERFYEISSSQLIADTGTGIKFKDESELIQDIEKIAVKNLENRRVRVIAKAVARPAAKYLLEKSQEGVIRKKYGNDAAWGFRMAAGFFNVYSERADLRSWQTLPAQIRIARLILDPGTYALSLNNFNAERILIQPLDLGKITISAGETRFLIVRTVQ